MRRFEVGSCLSISATVLAMLGGTAPALAQSNYFVLGDSYAFGYTTASATAQGNGAPSGGYYSGVANYLATSSGAKVTTTNLAIPGETTYSFLGNVDTDLPADMGHGIAYNTNYTTQTNQTAELGSLAAAKPSFVTIQLGGNDVIQYLYEVEYGQGGGTTAASAGLSQVISDSINNYKTILAQVKSAAAPNAKIFVIDYADPFVALDPTLNPAPGLQGLDVTATQQYDAALQSLAQTSGVGFVDIAGAFSNNKASTNYIGNFFYINDPSADSSGVPDFHPNAAGYSVIASQITSVAAAPEPDAAGLLLAATGVATALQLVKRKRTA